MLGISSAVHGSLVSPCSVTPAPPLPLAVLSVVWCSKGIGTAVRGNLVGPRSVTPRGAIKVYRKSARALKNTDWFCFAELGRFFCRVQCCAQRGNGSISDLVFDSLRVSLPAAGTQFQSPVQCAQAGPPRGVCEEKNAAEVSSECDACIYIKR